MNAPAPPSRTWSRRIPGRALRIGASVVLLCLIVATQDVGSALGAVAALAPGVVGLAVGLFVLRNVGMAVRWWTVLRGLGCHVPFGWVHRTVYVGRSASLLLPSSVGGDAVRGVLVRSTGLSIARAAASVLIDRGLGVAALGVLLVALSNAIPADLLSPEILLVARILVVTGAVGATGLVIWRARTGGGPTLDLRWLAPAAGTSLLTHVLTLAALVAMARGVGIDAPAVAVAACATTAWIAALVPVTIGGFGLREAVLVTLLGRIGVATDQALAVTLLWTTWILIEAAIGSLALPAGVKAKSLVDSAS